MKIKLLSLVALVFSLAVSGQNLDVKGTVTEAATGIPLPGVNVILKNTTKGTTTDFDGNFTLNDVPPNSIVVISYLGFITQEITITDNKPLNILLVEDTESLDEVVVIGYGTQSKKEVTGAVSVVSSEIGGDHTYIIESRSANEMAVRSTDGNGEFDWGFILIADE